MSLEEIRASIPEYARDLRLNLGSVLSPAGAPGLSETQIWLIALAAALAARNARFARALEALAAAQLQPAQLQAAHAAAAIMGMNNVYYRFLHLVGDSEYQRMPARLRMNVIANPGIDKVDFELASLAVSAINAYGLSIVARLRLENVPAPVLLLSALGTIDDRVEGLRAGGDDYLVKPFAFAELLARVEALLRRAAGDGQQLGVLRVADLEINVMARRVTRAGRTIDLTAKEFQLLDFLVRRAGQVVTRTMLLESVWNLHFDPQTNLIDVHISRLRQAIDREFNPALLHTIRGVGYC